ncbi:Cell division control protein 15 [Phytophthora citrophthora]|uniref:Cell division control protein 15 n=1 Tax=Phytophthora citrophthora TaxID=4793 RepID=A0AAD9G1L4_9STRA|nr:Cell division control protein 15 [Phytophthora citrophthora]
MKPDELRFEEGDVLRVVQVQDDGWWSGFNVEEPDVVGLFPSNYVQAQRNTQNTKSTINSVRNSRQRIQQQPQQPPDTPEFESEEEGGDDIVQELRSEFRGHVGTVLQLRKNLENAERAREAVRDARQQAERERLRHRKSWREREQDEDLEVEAEYSQANPQQQEDEEDEEEDESAFPNAQGSIHEVDQLEDEEEVEKVEEVEPPVMTAIEENEAQSDVESDHSRAIETAVRAAAVVIVRNYRRHAAIVRRKQSLEQETKQHREVAAVCIQRWAAHAQSRQRRRQQLEQNTARRRRQQENDAASAIQKWIRLRWACFWRRRVQVDRELRIEREAQQAEEQQRRQEAEMKQQLAQVEEERRLLEERQKLQDEAQQLQLKVVEEEVQRRFLEESNGQHDVGPAVVSPDAQIGKTRRKVMKKEAVDLIKTLVEQQLGETLRDHDTKMDELQRMVSTLQTVVRKQTAMLEDSTDELMALQMKRQEQQLPPRRNDAENSSLLPRIAAPRQPAAPSGLRAPRPVMLSKLPVIANGVRGGGFNQKKS